VGRNQGQNDHRKQTNQNSHKFSLIVHAERL
jgi:hypothetical protein